MDMRNMENMNEVCNYITNLQNNFKLAIQKAQDLEGEKQKIINQANYEIKRLSKEVKKANKLIENILSINETRNN